MNENILCGGVVCVFRSSAFSLLIVCLCVAEVQIRQASVDQLHEEVDQLRTQLEQMEQEKDSQLISLRQELVAQTQQLDGCQARVGQEHTVCALIQY